MKILSMQAQIILNLDNLSNAGRLDIQLAEQAEYDNRIGKCIDKKRVLYERLVLKQISMKAYKTQEAAIDNELYQLREIPSKLQMQTL